MIIFIFFMGWAIDNIYARFAADVVFFAPCDAKTLLLFSNLKFFKSLLLIIMVEGN